MIIGYCPHCGAKLTEIKNMGYFDDFTIKCWHCKKLHNVYELNFKRLDKEKEQEYNVDVN